MRLQKELLPAIQPSFESQDQCSIRPSWRIMPPAEKWTTMTSDPFESTINVTKPTLPSLDQFTGLLEQIWDAAWLTNNGVQVQQLEHRLKEYLGVPYLSTTCNGTLSLLLALKAVGLKSGSVVTTPFTFPATVSALDWLGFRPIFADVERATGNIDPLSVAERIEKDTVAVLAVHVYGNPCDNGGLLDVCRTRGLKLIYDAAHAFGVKVDGESVLCWGDASSLSFHATKLYSTVEGGAVVTSDEEVSSQVQMLRNFGILDEETVVVPGINAKMNELQAAYGHLRLNDIDEEIDRRAQVAEAYDRILKETEGIYPIPQKTNVDQNHSYYPIRVVPSEFSQNRNQLKSFLESFNVNTRKYFYPLCSRIPAFQGFDTARAAALPNAHALEAEVLCLPIFGELPVTSATRIAELIHSAGRRS